MSRKVIIHLCILIALICLAAVVWIQTGEKETVPDPTKVEMKENLMGELVPVNVETKQGLAEGPRIMRTIDIAFEKSWPCLRKTR